MKNLLLSALSLGCLWLGSAQNYQFTVTNETYTDLAGSTSLSSGIIWDDPEFSINLGFDFQIGNFSSNTLYLYESAVTTVDLNSSNVLPALLPFSADLVDRAYNGTNEELPGSISPVSYKIEGNPGSRIVKIEWKNAGFYDEYWDNGTTNDFINFQVWVYEGSNIVEYRFGTSSITNPDWAFDGESGPYVALITHLSLMNLDVQGFELSGNASSPVALPIDFAFENFLVGMPPSGIVYRFTPETLSTPRQELASVKIYPNPVQETLHIEMEKTGQNIESVVIYNSSGQKVVSTASNLSNISVGSLTQGVYILKIKTGSGSFIQRFIKN